MKYTVPFTQFLRPDGRRKVIALAVDKNTHEKAMTIINAGLSFEIEILTTGVVSATLSSRDADLLFDVGPNDDTLPGRMCRLIDRAFADLDHYVAVARDCE
jgi:hypothetical protein